MMTYGEFSRLRTEGKVAAGIDNSAAIRLINHLPRRYRAAHLFWSWVWMLSIPCFIVVAIFVKWWIGLPLLIIGTPLVYSSLKRSAAQFVLEHATENGEFFEFLVSKNLLKFKNSPGSDYLSGSAAISQASNYDFQAAAADRLVTAYTGILEQGPGLASESLLPAPRQDIKRALIAYAYAALKAHNYKMVEIQRAAYATLSNFRSPVEAEIVSRFNSLAEVVNANANPDPKDPKLLKLLEITKDYAAIVEHSRDDLMRLFLEFDYLVYKNHQPDVAAFWVLGEGASHGDADSQYRVGQTYHNGKGVPKEITNAAYWYEQAAKQGHAEAQTVLAAFYATGHGVPKDEVKAFEWYTKSAEQGNVHAQCRLGMSYNLGKGTPRDTNKAIYWLTRAAEQGDDRAQQALAVNYDSEHRSEKSAHCDPIKAAYWWLKAAEQGKDHAQRRLADLYAAGIGVPQDFYKAFMWYWLSYSHEQAASMAEKLTDSQIITALTEADAWDLSHGSPNRTIDKSLIIKNADFRTRYADLVKRAKIMQKLDEAAKTRPTSIGGASKDT